MITIIFGGKLNKQEVVTFNDFLELSDEIFNDVCDIFDNIKPVKVDKNNNEEDWIFLEYSEAIVINSGKLRSSEDLITVQLNTDYKYLDRKMYEEYIEKIKFAEKLEEIVPDKLLKIKKKKI